MTSRISKLLADYVFICHITFVRLFIVFALLQQLSIYDFLTFPHSSAVNGPRSTFATAQSASPNTKICCKNKGVDDFCVEKLCDTFNPPDEFVVFDVAARCPQYLSDISECLADGRNHRPCCESRSRNSRAECLHLCDGTGTTLSKTNWEHYKHYISCLTFNIRPMYTCMREGYQNGPSVPSGLKLTRTGATTATIEWDEPASSSHLVSQYSVYYREVANSSYAPSSLSSVASSRYLKISTSNTVCKLSALNPDTKYVIYVEAIGKDGFSSLPSENFEFVTRGVAPTVQPHHPTQLTALNTLATLVCNVRVYGTQHLSGLNFVWQKRDKLQRTEYTELLRTSATERAARNGNDKYEIISYKVMSESGTYSLHDAIGQKHYIMALRIHNVNVDDFTSYRCVAQNNFGEHFSTVHLGKQNSVVPPTQPTNLTACCEREGVHPKCLNTCRSSAATMSPDGDSFDSSPSFQCAMEVPVVLKCSTEGMNYDSCCLAKGVPFRCLPFCDGSISSPLSPQLYSCFMQTTDILSCHLEAKAPLPYPPNNIRVLSKSYSEVSLKWDAVVDVHMYHIYYRQNLAYGGGSLTPWQRQSSRQPYSVLNRLDTNALYEVIILSANQAGVSDSSKPIFTSLKDSQLQHDSPMDFYSSASPKVLRQPRN